MATTRALETVLADLRQSANALDRTHDHAKADLIREICKDVELAAEDYLTWVTETDAVLWSNRAKDWLMQRFPAWERLGHAKWSDHGKKQRLYRRCILPRSADVSRARANAIATAREDAAA